MRPTRLIYVENDPALLGVMSTVLRSQPMLDLIFASSGPLEVLGSEYVEQADVALLDLALGRDTLTGMDLGMALRNRNPVVRTRWLHGHSPAQLNFDFQRSPSESVNRFVIRICLAVIFGAETPSL